MVLFKVPRVYGGVELSGLIWYVRYNNAAGNGDIVRIGSGEIDKDIIYFTWNPDGIFTAEIGRAEFDL